jgi:hypothetical protein
VVRLLDEWSNGQEATKFRRTKISKVTDQVTNEMILDCRVHKLRSSKYMGSVHRKVGAFIPLSGVHLLHTNECIAQVIYSNLE